MGWELMCSYISLEVTAIAAAGSGTNNFTLYYKIVNLNIIAKEYVTEDIVSLNHFGSSK